MSEEIVGEIRELPMYPGYGASADGRIWSRWKRRQRKPSVIRGEWTEMGYETMERGHKRVTIRCGGLNTKVFVHVLVLTAFVGPAPAGLNGLHGDGNPANNQVGNLRWGTQKENMEDRSKHGTHVYFQGVDHWNAKLAEADVVDILARMKSGERQESIAVSHEISVGLVSSIATRKVWRHVTDKHFGPGESCQRVKMKRLPDSAIIEMEKFILDGWQSKFVATLFDVSQKTVTSRLRAMRLGRNEVPALEA